ncbi:MAG: dihydroorotase family protein [Calditrichaceae bacterium]
MRILLVNGLLDGKTLCNILIDNERIAYIGDETPPHDQSMDLNKKLILPGLIDPHTHMRDMELSLKEDWETGSKAAAAGGVTTIFDMPNTRPATFDVESLEIKRKAAVKSIVNYGFNFGVTEKNLGEIEKARNIPALKMFMAESSSGYVIDTKKMIKKVFRLAQQINKPVIVHSELQSCVEAHSKKYQPVIGNHNHIRNRECAVKSTEILLDAAGETNAALYLAHVSTREEIMLIRQAKQNGLKNVYCEITPHHLLINESVLGTAGNFGKVNPPLRTADDNDALYEGLLDGTVDTIGSDHAPHTLAEKQQAYTLAPSGFPGLETTLPLLFTEVDKGRLPMTKLIELTSHNPALIFKIKNRGEIRVGAYADLAILDPKISGLVDAGKFYTKARYSPYQGYRVHGKVSMTFVNGNIVFRNDQFSKDKGKEVEFR